MRCHKISEGPLWLMIYTNDSDMDVENLVGDLQMS